MQPQRRPLTILLWLARQYLQSLWKWVAGGKRTRVDLWRVLLKPLLVVVVAVLYARLIGAKAPSLTMAT